MEFDLFHWMLVQEVLESHKLTTYQLKRSNSYDEKIKNARMDLTYKLRENGLEWGAIAKYLNTNVGTLHTALTLYCYRQNLPLLTRSKGHKKK